MIMGYSKPIHMLIGGNDISRNYIDDIFIVWV